MSDPAIQRLQHMLSVHRSIENICPRIVLLSLGLWEQVLSGSGGRRCAGELSAVPGVSGHAPPARCCAGNDLDGHKPLRGVMMMLVGPEVSIRVLTVLRTKVLGAGEGELIGLREIIESDFPSRSTRVMNSSNSLVGVSSHACAPGIAAASASLSCPRCMLLLVHMLLSHPCMMHVIQLFLVGCCLCTSPPVTTWRLVARVPRRGGVPKVEWSQKPSWGISLRLEQIRSTKKGKGEGRNRRCTQIHLVLCSDLTLETLHSS